MGVRKMDRYLIKKKHRGDERTYILQDQQTKTEAEVIPGVGFNLFRYETAGQSMILSPPSLEGLKEKTEAHFKYGTPILFPPNRVKGGTFTYKGKTYQLPLNEPTNHLHGEICYRPWKVVERGASDEEGAYLTAQFRYRDHADLLSYFPHPMVFTLTYRLSNGQIHLKGSIRNDGEEEAPFAFGLHPYFVLSPLNQEQIEIVLPAAEEWPVTQDAFVTGLPQVTDLSKELNKGVPLTKFPAGSCWLFRLQNHHQPCMIRNHQTGMALAYQVDPSFPFVILFRPVWADSISFEPYTYVTDAFNLPWDNNVTGARGLSTDQEFKFETKIWNERIDKE